jgi:teichoic acid transport system permease protein
VAQTAVAGPEPGLALKDYARRNGLTAAGRLPTLAEYSRQLWKYRHFIWEFASAKVTASLGKTRLGMIWQVLTPLFNAAVYYLIFGLLLGTDRGIDNFVAYLCIGVFIFGFTQATVQAGVQAISSNLGLIRALHFPRASMPIAVALIEARNMIASMAVLFVIVLAFGEPITVQWLLLIPALLLQTVFNAGTAMLVSRLGAKLNDLRQLTPFIMRVWLYGSAVIYPVTAFEERVHNPVLLAVVESNPLLIFIELMRHALMEEIPLANPAPVLWIKAVVWTTVMGVGGYVYFWRGEKGYGRG